MNERKRRTEAQNRFMWPMFRQIAQHLNKANAGSGQATLTDEDMHDYFLDQYQQEVVAVPSLGIAISKRGRTSDMTVAQFAGLLEFTMAWASTRGISVMVPKDYEAWAERARYGKGYAAGGV